MTEDTKLFYDLILHPDQMRLMFQQHSVKYLLTMKSHFINAEQI